MNQQSDSSDLLGGYKPVMIGRIIQPLREEFETLFCKTFSRKQNQTFLSEYFQALVSRDMIFSVTVSLCNCKAKS